jgi:hypothetical protein
VPPKRFLFIALLLRCLRQVRTSYRILWMLSLQCAGNQTTAVATSTVQTVAMFGTASTGTGFGGFGGAPAGQPTVGFGAATATPVPSAFGTSAGGGFGTGTTSAFGAKPAQATVGFGSTAAPAQSFGFGATTPAPATASGFGTPAATTGFGGFGATPAAAAPSTAGFGGFGNSTSFGQPAAQNKPLTTFGSFGQPTGGTGALSFGQPLATQQGALQMQAAPSTIGKIAKSIEKLQQAYAPYQDVNGKVSAMATAGRYNDECMFKTYMYDRRNGATHISDPSLSGALLEQVNRSFTYCL